MTIIADTGFVIAVAIISDDDHDRYTRLYNQLRVIYLPQSTLTEIGHLLVKAGGNRAMGHFLTHLPEMKYKLVALEPTDLKSAGELLIKCDDSRVDFVDASIAAVAERIGERAARAVGLDPAVLWVVRGLPNPAFTIGWIRPRIYVTSDLSRELNEGELRAVLAHEGAHVGRRDPLRLGLLRFLAHVVFWIPALRRLAADMADESEVQADDVAARHDPLDADRMLAHHMARAVARDMHKMHAFVRFRPVVEPDGHTVHMAWFEPDHYIVDRVAPFFMRRFAGMRWAILTPYRSVQWDGEHLWAGEGAQRSDAPADDAEDALWRTYYANIFNPARLNTRMMRQEMPQKYWKHLPETHLLPDLVREAGRRVREMDEREAQGPRRRIPGRPRTPG